MRFTFAEWLTFLSVAANVVTIAGIFALGIQLSQSKRQFQLVVRARLTVAVEKIQLNGRPSLGLVISNCGQTAARDVTLTFDSGQKFHALKGHQNLAFLEPNKIDRIESGETLTFTLGPLKGAVNMDHIFTSSISGLIHYRALDQVKPVSERFVLTLSQRGFLISRSNVNRPKV
jgi:hypothetical protein